ncbi:hypothetical protein PACTADRAFT_48569 [Pachysolen tannophilus NRRL Y-2460]|uniref:Endopolyphosphatase n=1 Tax=Pachysolen tannophilus NRRL Y-2460 TaxID=669874 RepID=A0A1E4TYE7_PACTA|nr:hypothetical protein PACTADRAFT_48569 [Pachysolen tannophilus NRRL Y-2460]
MTKIKESANGGDSSRLVDGCRYSNSCSEMHSRRKNNIYKIVLPLIILLLLGIPLTIKSHHLVDEKFNDNIVISDHNNNNNNFKITYIPKNDDEISDLEKLGLTVKPSVEIENIDLKTKKVIHGRFLHITDIHPDEYYKVGSDYDEACHQSKKGSKHKHHKASKYGDAMKGCDSPLILMEDTLKWISDNLKDKIDFVVWTGDNMRHDNDRNYPRLEKEIFTMNEKVAGLFDETFKDLGENNTDPRERRIKIIPSLGNNDVYPHNLFAPGPTVQTREMWRIWKNYVPAEQLHVFARGAYFFSEVIPNKLAVLSINTLYLYQANPVVDNCDKKKQPGYKLFEWLGVTLKELRSRGMKVWLTGHVPPNPKNYDKSCLRKHIVWLYEYRDIIIGSLYGHMNIDHFIPLDAVKAYKSINKKLKKAGLSYDAFNINELNIVEEEFEVEYNEEEEIFDENNLSEFFQNYDDDFETLDELISTFFKTKGDFDSDDENNENLLGAYAASEAHLMGGSPSGKVDYMNSIRDVFYSRVKGKKKSGVSSERYSIAHITASVVPTFNPGIRVWEYNITELYENGEVIQANPMKPWSEFFADLEKELFPIEEDSLMDQIGNFATDSGLDDNDYESDFMTESKLVEILKKDKTFPPKMPSNAKLGPAYTGQLFSPVRYVQYFANLTAINDKEIPFGYDIQYYTDDDNYQLDSLLVDDWVKLSRKLGAPIKEDRKDNNKNKNKKKNKKKKKKSTKLTKRDVILQDDKIDIEQSKNHKKLENLWREFLARSFIYTGYEKMKSKE